MRIYGNQYSYIDGEVFKGNDSIIYLQIGDDRDYLEDQLENINEEKSHFSYEGIVDAILSAYDY